MNFEEEEHLEADTIYELLEEDCEEVKESRTHKNEGSVAPLKPLSESKLGK